MPENRTALRLLLASCAVLLVCAGNAAAVTPSVLPPAYEDLQARLVGSCGGTRAAVIAALTYDEEIHREWSADVQAHPADGKLMGDVQWHGYWVSVYKHAIELLKGDCK